MSKQRLNQACEQEEPTVYQGAYCMNQYFSAEYISSLTKELMDIALSARLDPLFYHLWKAWTEAERFRAPLIELEGPVLEASTRASAPDGTETFADERGQASAQIRRVVPGPGKTRRKRQALKLCP